MRRCLPPILFTAAMSLSLPALADPPPNCPPGSWFCAEAEVQVPPAPQPPKVVVPPIVVQPPVVVQPPEVVQPPVVEEEEAPPVAPPPVRRPRIVVQAPQPRTAPPPVVIYQPVPAAPPTRVIIVTRGYGYGYGYPQPPQQPQYRVVRPVAPPPPVAPARPKWHPEWGLGLRVEGATLGKGAAEGSGMGGVGLSLRYRPVPAFAFDMGVDVLGGIDYNGFDRTETPVSLSGVLFVNPKSRVQFYLLGGANYSHAKVKSKEPSPLLSRTGDRTEDGFTQFGASYSYLGGQGGAGLEFRLGRHMGINVDALGFVRHRTDDGPNPEFRDPKTGQDTKTSGGGLFRGGLSFWW